MDAAPQIDLDVLAGWMDAQGLPPGPLEDVEDLVGGTQNVLVRFRRGGETYVLRRGPWHLRPKSNDALRREIEPDTVGLDPLDRADREQSLSSWLTGHGVGQAWTIAPPLAAAGVDTEWCERAAVVRPDSSPASRQ